MNKIIRNNLHANRGQNIFIVLAILLTTFLLSIVLSVGMSYMKSQETQQIRLLGTNAHVAIDDIDDEQISILHTLDYIESYGIGYNAGSVEQTDNTYGMALNLYWCDEDQWQKLRIPAYTDVVGEYPQDEDEIIAPLWVLNKMGIDDPWIGMNIILSIQVDTHTELFTKTFKLSGWFTDYSNVRTGNIDVFYVSEAFASKTGHTCKEDGSVLLRFKSDDIKNTAKLLANDLTTDISNIRIVPTYDINLSDMIAVYVALGIFVILLMLTGYLLIFNVLDISISKDIRFYGLLKAVGTAPQQIRRIIYGQILRLCIIGVSAGLLLSLIFSYVLVPVICNSLAMVSIDTGIVVSFNPVIYISAAVFALGTALISAIRPARKISCISPIEAMRYTGVIEKSKTTTRSVYGNPFRMAWRNVFRVRKRAVAVFLSLFLGMTIFLTVITIVNAMDIDNYVNSYLESDIILTNELGFTIGMHNKERITDDMLATLRSTQGLIDMRIYTVEGGLMTYDADIFRAYTESMYKIDEINEEILKDNFITFVIGISKQDIEELNTTLDSPIDIEAFERGEIGIVSTNNRELFDNVTHFEISFISAKAEIIIPLGGIVPSHYKSNYYGEAPNVYVSQSLLEELFDDPTIYRVELDVEEKYQKDAISLLDTLTKDINEITQISKYDTRENMKSIKMMMYILGGGVSVVLGLIGVFNFVNIIFTGIYMRRHEIAVLESIGQSKRQTRNMLISEGIIYVLLSSLLVCTIGNGITYGLFILFRQQADYAVYSFPYIQLTVVITLISIICVIVPCVAYRFVSKATIIERLGETT